MAAAIWRSVAPPTLIGGFREESFLSLWASSNMAASSTPFTSSTSIPGREEGGREEGGKEEGGGKQGRGSEERKVVF